jgi:hypothetical protein
MDDTAFCISFKVFVSYSDCNTIVLQADPNLSEEHTPFIFGVEDGVRMFFKPFIDVE